MPFVLDFTAHPALEVPFASGVADVSCMREGCEGDMPFVLLCTAHPTLEVPFASVGRAVGCLLVWLGYQGIARFGALAFVNSFNRKGNCKY